MLKILKKTTFTRLATPILVITSLVITSGMVLQQPAHASTHFCNNTNSKVYVAYARGETYGGQANLPPGTGQSVSDASTEYRVQGWWGLNPGGCAIVTNEPANQVVKGNYLYYVTHRYYARAVDLNNYWIDTYWAGNENFCISNARFDYSRSLGGYAPIKPLICTGDYYQVGFRQFTSTTTDYTINFGY